MPGQGGSIAGHRKYEHCPNCGKKGVRYMGLSLINGNPVYQCKYCDDAQTREVA